MTRHQQQVLVVSELHSIYSNIQRILTTQGLHSTHIQAVDKASIAIEEKQFHIIILDSRLPQSTDFYQHLRRALHLPVLVLTENNSATNGAASAIDKDDCLYLSFDPTELIDAVRTVRQRCNSAKSKKTPPIHLGSVTINLDRFEATRDDEVIRLTRTEWSLLELLVLHANTTLTHHVLLQRIWGDAYVDEHSYLHTYVRRLRRKLEVHPNKPRYLVTDVGIGYRLIVSQHGSVASHTSSEPAPHSDDTTGRSRHLTAPPTSFLGRERDLDTLENLLEKPDIRLLTLTGPPGVGKTRLALHLVEHLGNHFVDGAHVISLAPLHDSGLVVSAIAQALEIKEITQQSLEETLKQALQKQAMLLLLDNFEHVLEAAPVLVELITAAPQLTILVTSRTPLRVAGEQEYLVAPLEMPDAITIMTKEIAEANPAVQLFVQRSQSVKADFALTEENAAAIAGICTRLDGLPLAIELAAARSKLFTPQTLLARLDERLDILTQGLRGAPERHQTLRAALEWSYNLLTPEEQHMLMGLSVFAGGCTLEAATAVLDSDQVLVTPLALPEHTTPAEPEPIDVSPSTSFLDKVASLVDHSLIQVQTDSNSESRFVLLETIREYAWEKLQKSERSESIQQRHAEYYLWFAEKAASKHSNSPEYWLKDLNREYQNVRSALTWIIEEKELILSLRMGLALWKFWWISGQFNEGFLYLKEILDISETNLLINDIHYRVLRAKVLNVLGGLLDDNTDLAMTYFKKSLDLLRTTNDKKYLAHVLNNLGNLLDKRGNYTSAIEYHRESLSLRLSLDDRWGVAVSLVNLGLALLRQGDQGQSRQVNQQSYEIFQAIDDKLGVLFALNNIGRSFMYTGQYIEATHFCGQALNLSRELKNKRFTAHSLVNLARIRIDQHKYHNIIELYKESVGIFREMQDIHGCIDCIEALTEFVVNKQQMNDAAILCGAAQALRDAKGLPLPPVDLPRYERTLSITRNHLDEVTWQQAWEAGQKMSLEEAIDYALAHVLVDERVVGEETH